MVNISTSKDSAIKSMKQEIQNHYQALYNKVKEVVLD
jgi:hypothetical protein